MAPHSTSNMFLCKVVATNEITIIEVFAGNHSAKYINNGSIHCKEATEIQQKAESFTHLLYIKSKELIVLDIQGSGYSVTGPEIPTVDGNFDDQNNLLFCVGNLSRTAVAIFFKQNSSNKYCRMLDLQPACENSKVLPGDSFSNES